MTETRFTHPEMEKLARLVNNFGILGSQLICLSRPDLGQNAQANLQNLKNSDQQLFETSQPARA